MSDSVVSRGPTPPFPPRPGFVWEYDAKCRSYRWYDPKLGAWVADEYLRPRPTVEQLMGPPSTVPAALPAFGVPAIEPLDSLPTFAPDPAKLALRGQHAATLALIDSDLPNLRDQVVRFQERLDLVRVQVLNGVRSECGQEQGYVLEAEANLRRAEQEAKGFRSAIVALDAELLAEEKKQRDARRCEIERRLKALGVRMHTLLVAARDTRDLGAELKRLRHRALEPDQQRQLGAWEWPCVGIDRVLDQLEQALRQDNAC